MANIADLVVSLKADIADFRTGMDQANQHLSQMRQQSSDAAEAIKGLSSVMEGIASAETIRRIADFGASLVESAARLQEVTQALGVNAEQYQVLGVAAQQAGVPTDVFARSMEVLARNIDLVSTGGAANVAKVFAELGLSVHNADGSIRSAGDVLEDLAHNRLFEAESEAQKFAQVMILTGGRSAEAGLLINALNGNLKDFAAASKQAQEAGLILDDQTLKGAEELETSISNIWTRIKNRFTEGIVDAYKNPLGSLMGEWQLPPAPGQQQEAGSPPPGPAVVDPTQAKQLQSFQETYQKLLQTEQQDADYQAKLRAAYQEGAAEVAKVAAAHAADKAQLELLEAAQRDHVTATQAEITAVRDAAAANELNTRAAAAQKQLTDAMAESQKKYSDQVTVVMSETDGLTEKQNKLADALGILEQQLVSGNIQWDEYVQRAKAAQQVLDNLGANQGDAQFAKGLSSDLDTAIGKMTDFSAMIEEKQKTKGKDSIFAQLSQDANEFTESLEKLLLKLLIINPLLNSLGLGEQGNGKQLPTLWGGIGGSAGSPSSSFNSFESSVASGGKSVLSFLSGLFGGMGGPGSTVDADATTGASLNGDIVDALSDGALGMMAFAYGGDFTVGGSGGTDSQRVSFLASPGERVSVRTPEAASADNNNNGRRGMGGDININMPISGVHSDSFMATKDQIMSDLIRAISASKRYA
jgi:hypothetical protein